MIDFVNGSKAAAGIDLLLSKRIGSYTEVGAYLPLKATNTEDGKGYCVKQEFKYFWAPDTTNTQPFGSIELFHSQLACLRTDIFDSTGQYEFDRPLGGYSKTYFEKHSYTGFTLNGGMRHSFSPRWYIDISGGVGLRINRLKPALSDKEADYRFFGDWTVPFNYTQARGTHLIPKMSIGLRLGYRFH